MCEYVPRPPPVTKARLPEKLIPVAIFSIETIQM